MKDSGSIFMIGRRQGEGTTKEEEGATEGTCSFDKETPKDEEAKGDKATRGRDERNRKRDDEEDNASKRNAEREMSKQENAFLRLKEKEERGAKGKREES